ncbi:hypothetical protein H5399_00955 [Tessaracoccus sp. MC1627]|uniref:hypothetical protein n=1 Tax=Tessaracoccus sp. MC1627 TaxID=2760312 RepID=UPI0015FECB53|nr:hypothetical protein [Tessaracoccus sp. MC1627]MBB1511179.1 hypothetical protein [Tessaracoccus sp. MC1627]
MFTFTRLAAAALVAGATVAVPLTAHAGVTGPAFYVDGVMYRTVGTPTDLSGTGAPAHAWDTIYSFDSAQPSVATAAPGDPGYNGGRWMVHALSFPNGYAAALASSDLDHDGVIDTTAEVTEALATGDAVDDGVVKYFVCPVIKVPASR